MFTYLQVMYLPHDFKPKLEPPPPHRDYNLELVFLDPDSGPLPHVSAMFHKMSDLLFEAEDGDEQSIKDLAALLVRDPIKYMKTHSEEKPCKYF